MNEIIKHPEFGEIRTVIRKGEPWFSRQDVLEALGMQSQGKAGSQYLDDDEKGVEKIHTPGGPQEMATVNESGLYTLIMRSNKPAARQFRKWVTGEVLPSIRKHGFYVHPQMMSRKEETRLKRELAARVDRYLTEDDRRKIAKKFGRSVVGINYVVRGVETDNAIMQECQLRALANKEKELNAYQPERIREVIDILAR